MVYRCGEDSGARLARSREGQAYMGSVSRDRLPAMDG